MPYKTPGVYIEEVSSGSKPIAGVGTSTGAFLGLAKTGPLYEARMITNWTQFVKFFGGFDERYKLPYTVWSFFSEGGTKCFVTRAGKVSSTKAECIIKDAAGADLLKVTDSYPGEDGNNIWARIVKVNEKRKTFSLGIYNGDPDQESPNMLEAYQDRTVEDIDDIPSKRFKISQLAVTESLPAEGNTPLEGGSDGKESDNITWMGTPANKKGFHAFDVKDDVNIVAAPDAAGNPDVMKYGITYCFNRRDAFFIADPGRGTDIEAITKFGEAISSPKGFGALYYPWVTINNPNTGKRVLVPPSGLAAGSFAHTDSTRGVHKAPAGVTEGFLNIAVALEMELNAAEQENLNDMGINAIRRFSPEGICLWGCRNITADAEWKYINVRRLFLYIEESIQKASTWVVFEPNDPQLWGKVKRNITAFLTRVWRSGALFGSIPEEAFFVQIDEENNPPEERDAGNLNITIACAPVKPAEFVIIKISQKTL